MSSKSSKSSEYRDTFPVLIEPARYENLEPSLPQQCMADLFQWKMILVFFGKNRNSFECDRILKYWSNEFCEK
jgi:hypothetical protein